MALTRTNKVLATGAALLGVVLGAAGIAAATTSSESSQRSPAAVHAQQPGASTTDTPEANDVPDNADGTDKADANDKTDANDGGSDASEGDGQG